MNSKTTIQGKINNQQNNINAKINAELNINENIKTDNIKSNELSTIRSKNNKINV